MMGDISNVHPRTPHFYIVKLGFTGYTLFSYFCSKHRLWVLIRNASVCLTEAVLTCSHNLCFEQKYEKYYSFSYENYYSREKLQYIT